MTAVTDSYLLKLDRAQEHWGELSAAFSAFCSNNPNPIETESYVEGQIGHLVAKARISRPLPPQLSVVLGEFFYNTRSALDHLVTALTVKHSGRELEKTAFPVFIDEQKFHARSRSRPSPYSGIHKIRGVHPDAAAVIEGLQPYQRRKQTPPLDPRGDPLWILDELTNIDKHRRLHITPAIIRDASYGFDPRIPLFSVEIQPGPVQDGTEILHATFDGSVAERYAEVDMNANFPLQMVLDEAGSATGEPLRDVMFTILTYVRNQVVEPIRVQFLPPNP